VTIKNNESNKPITQGAASNSKLNPNESICMLIKKEQKQINN